MAYGKPSSFLDQAKQRNVPYAEGFGMLVGQAIEASLSGMVYDHN